MVIVLLFFYFLAVNITAIKYSKLQLMTDRIQLVKRAHYVIKIFIFITLMCQFIR